MTEFRLIIQLSTNILQKFNSSTHTIETFCDEYLNDEKISQAIQNLVNEICYGIDREHRLINSFIELFYETNSSKILRSEMQLYKILAYVIIFEALCVTNENDDLKKLLETQNELKIAPLLNYFNDPCSRSQLRLKWASFVDYSYIDTTLFPRIAKRWEGLSSFIASINAKVYAVDVKKLKKKPVTRPVSPNITKPIMSPPPEPELISSAVTVVPVPESIYRNSLETIEAERNKQSELAREQTLSKYNHKDEFKFHETLGGKTLESLRKEREDELTSQLGFDQSFMNPPPDFNKNQAAIRLNAAAIFREDYLIKKQEEKDEELMIAYEKQLKDASEFTAWQIMMKANDDLLKLQNVDNRREMAKLSSEEARQSILKQKENNREMAAMIRQEAEEILKKKHIEDERICDQKRVLANQLTRENEEKLRTVQEALTREKLDSTAELKSQLERARKKKFLLDKFEEQNRLQKVKELKELLDRPRPTVAAFDPTTPVHVGVLDEMSYAELMLHLSRIRLESDKFEAQKRQEIIESKNKRASDLQSKAENIMKLRQKKAYFATMRAQKKKEYQLQLTAQQEKQLIQSALKLEEQNNHKQISRQVELNRLRQEERKILEKQKQIGIVFSSLEKQREDELLKAIERQAKTYHESFVQSINVYENCRTTEKKNRDTAKSKQLAKKLTDLQHREIEISNLKTEMIRKNQENDEKNKSLVKQVHEDKVRLKSMMTACNPYATMITEEIHQETLQRPSKKLTSISKSKIVSENSKRQHNVSSLQDIMLNKSNMSYQTHNRYVKSQGPLEKVKKMIPTRTQRE